MGMKGLFNGDAYRINHCDPTEPLADRVTGGRLAIAKFCSTHVDVALFSYEPGYFSEGSLGEWKTIPVATKHDGEPKNVQLSYNSLIPKLEEWYNTQNVSETVISVYAGISPLKFVPIGIESLNDHLEYEENYEEISRILEEQIKEHDETVSMDTGYSFIASSNGSVFTVRYSTLISDAALNVIERAGGVCVKLTESTTCLFEYAMRQKKSETEILVILADELALRVDLNDSELFPYRPVNDDYPAVSNSHFKEAFEDPLSQCVVSLSSHNYEQVEFLFEQYKIKRSTRDPIVEAICAEPELGLVYDCRTERDEYVKPINPRFKALAYGLVAVIIFGILGTAGILIAMNAIDENRSTQQSEAIFAKMEEIKASIDELGVVAEKAKEYRAWTSGSLNVQHFSHSIFDVLQEYGEDIRLRELFIGERDIHDEFSFKLVLELDRTDLPVAIAQSIDERNEQLGYESISIIGGSSFGMNSNGHVVFSDDYAVPIAQKGALSEEGI